MVSAGVPLVEVAQVLRHHSLQSTAIAAQPPHGQQAKPCGAAGRRAT
jgi:hypothetical protein